MSIENSLSSIAKSLETIAAHLTNNATPVASPAPVVAAPVAPTPMVSAPVIAPPVTMAPAMPPVVTPFVAATPTAPSSPSNGVPFTDSKGMITFVMAAYKSLGTEKGAQIQGVLASLGVANINEVKPEQYAALFAGIEALK